MLCLASSSRLVVGCFVSRKPTWSARIEPRVIRMMLGLVAAKEPAESVKMNITKLARRTVDRDMICDKREFSSLFLHCRVGLQRNAGSKTLKRTILSVAGLLVIVGGTSLISCRISDTHWRGDHN